MILVKNIQSEYYPAKANLKVILKYRFYVDTYFNKAKLALLLDSQIKKAYKEKGDSRKHEVLWTFALGEFVQGIMRYSGNLVILYRFFLTQIADSPLRLNARLILEIVTPISRAASVIEE